MKITILNGNPDPNNLDFERYVQQLDQTLQARQHKVTTIPLRDLDLRYCTGCFGCWVKTPGECITPDDGPQVRRAAIQADFLLWAAPLRMGFPSALMKKMMDKFIPLIHPYFVVDHNEAHHRARYEHYPLTGLLLAPETDTDAGDIRIVSDITSRTALNMKSRLVFAHLTRDPVEQVAAAIEKPDPTGIAFEPQPRPTQGMQVSPPQRITFFNGSPRGAKGNTPILLEQFGRGFTSLPGRSTEVFHLNHTREAERFQQAFANAECAWLGFPLYTDAMPGLVKAFIETLEPLRGRPGNPSIGFLVQSGFPEAVHSRHVERYLEKLAARLGSPYLGTIVKGSGEGVRLMPENMNRKLFDALQQLGRTFAESGRLDTKITGAIARPERYPAIAAPLFKLLSYTPLFSAYWDPQLKENGVFDQRFAKPYQE